MTIGTRVILISAASIGLATVVATVIQKQTLGDQGIELTKNTMRATVLSAENVRQHIGQLHNEGAFDQAAMRKSAAAATDKRKSSLFDSVPVFAAMKSIADVAAKEGFEFRVPKHQARNPANEPTAEESAILDVLEKTGEEEYFTADRHANLIVYARPIRLTKDCLMCHGDPATSATHDGKDPLGFRMEGWHEGELHGAFLLKAHLDQVDKVASAQAAAAAMKTTLAWMIPIALLLIGMSYWFSSKTVIKPLATVVQIAIRASAESSAASGQISSASETLAQEATEQSAALNGITDALESFAGQSREAAAGARRVKTLAKESRDAAVRSGSDMRHMDGAMQEIQTAGNQVSKVVKSIDQIAFQTNLLALNAAVEAARAGESGAGFAVVADEVRALAQRSAEAAKETAALIAEMLTKTENGAEISRQVVGQLEEMEGRAQALDEAVSSITAAADEQLTKIESVENSVREIAATTQSVAAQAEESAAAATELKAQADSVSQSIHTLNSVVGWKRRFGEDPRNRRRPDTGKRRRAVEMPAGQETGPRLA